MSIAKAIATVGGIGYIKKGGGTVAAIAYCLFWYWHPAIIFRYDGLLCFIIVALGIYCGNVVEKYWGKDSYKVVIDEVAGMAIALLSISYNVKFALIALVLFRLFDIFKPLGIKQLEKLPGGWGVMADDILAGFYALLILKLYIFIILKII